MANSTAILTSLSSNKGTQGDEKKLSAGATEPFSGLLELTKIPLQISDEEFVKYGSYPRPKAKGHRRRGYVQPDDYWIENKSAITKQSSPCILVEMFTAVSPSVLKKLHIIDQREEAERILEYGLPGEYLLRFTTTPSSLTNGVRGTDMLCISVKSEFDNSISHNPMTDGFMDGACVRMELAEFKTMQAQRVLNSEELKKNLQLITNYLTDQIIKPLIGQQTQLQKNVLKYYRYFGTFIYSLKPLYFFLSGRALIRELETNLNANALVALRFWIYGLIKLGGKHPALAHLIGVLQSTILPSIEVELGKVKKELDAKIEDVSLNTNHALLIQKIYHYILGEMERSEYAIPALRQLTCSLQERVAVFMVAGARLCFDTPMMYPNESRRGGVTNDASTIMRRLDSIYVNLLIEDRSYYFAVKEQVDNFMKMGREFPSGEYVSASACFNNTNMLLGKIRLEDRIRMKTDIALALKDSSEKNKSSLRFLKGNFSGPLKLIFQLWDERESKGVLSEESLPRAAFTKT